MTTNTTRATSLPTLPSMPGSTRKGDLHNCACGCGFLTQRTFVPGHDSRLKGLILRLTRNIMTLEAIVEWGGSSTARAVEIAIEDAGLMKRWNLTEDVARYTEGREAAAEAAELAALEADIEAAS